MESTLYEIWQALQRLYFVVASAGYTGCVVALVAGYICNNRGEALSGRPESYSGPVHNGHAELRHNPAIAGTARGPLGRLMAVILKLAGLILIIIGILALVNVAMYGPARR